MSDDIQKRLEQAKRDREEALRLAAAKDSTVEHLGRAVQRLLGIIERLRKGQPSDAERVLIATLQTDVKGLRARREVAREARAKATTAAQRLKQLIARLRDKLETGKFTMEDSVTSSAISRSVAGAAGYVDGIFRNMAEIEAGPWRYKVSIAVLGGDAMVCDIEPGCMTTAEGVAWAKGRKRPRVYTFLSNAQPVVDALERAGLHRSAYQLWIAHDTGAAHICTPACGSGLKTRADATQYGLDGHGTGRNVDISLVRGSFV